MRKQYHFRTKGDDIYIWDIHRLVKLTKDYAVKEIYLYDIKELNEPYWYPTNLPTTQDIIDHFLLIQAADLNYPIILCSQERVMDGMHRVATAKILRKNTIKAVQFLIDPEPDYVNINENDLIYDN